MRSDEKIAGEDLGKCPFCGGKIGASLDPPAAIHSLPLCAKYISLDVDDFLRAVRRKRDEQRWGRPS